MMPCLIVISKTGSQADLDAALAVAPADGERFAVVPDHVSPPPEVASLRASGIGDAFFNQLRCSTLFAFRPHWVIGDAVAVLEIASVADLSSASAKVVGASSRAVRKALKSVYAEVEIVG